MIQKLKEITVHIGSHKCGSTSIQDFCAADKSILSSIGVLYPCDIFDQYPKQHSHIMRLLSRNSEDQVLLAFQKIVEMASSQNLHHVFISGEDLCMMSAVQVEKFAAICDQFFEKKRFAFIVRNKYEFALSSFKHHMRYAPPVSEIEFHKKIVFNPRFTIDTWREFFSLDAILLRYEDIQDDLLLFFFQATLGVKVDCHIFNNVSLDFLTLSIINTFLKEWSSRDLDIIIWNIAQKHKGKMTFPVEYKIAQMIADNSSNDGWCPIEFRRGRSLLENPKHWRPEHDPIAVCEKMLDFFTLLREYFSKLKDDELTRDKG